MYGSAAGILELTISLDVYAVNASTYILIGVISEVECCSASQGVDSFLPQ
jgi:hypothetical protein